MSVAFRSAYQVLNRCSCSFEWAESNLLSSRLWAASSFHTLDHNIADSRVSVGLGSPATCMRSGMFVRGVEAHRLVCTRFQASLFEDVGLLMFLWIVRLMVS